MKPSRRLRDWREWALALFPLLVTAALLRHFTQEDPDEGNGNLS